MRAARRRPTIHRRADSLFSCCVLLILLLCGTPAARAHPAPYSFLDLYLDAEVTRGALTVHDFDAAHELGIADPATLLDPATARAHRERLIVVLQPRLQLQAGGAPLQIRWGDIEVLAQRESLRLPFELDVLRPGRLDLQLVLFPHDPQHLSFINVYEDGMLRHQSILDAGNPATRYYSGTAQGRWSVVRTFVSSGIHHILIGPDHILFLIGLLLLGGGLRRLTLIITAFTLGHSVTLSLAAMGLLQIAPRLIEPAIALSIVVVGLDNLLAAPRGGARPPLRRDLRPWLAGIFGLIHGFGFASVLLEFGLPRDALGWSLASFNIGVELGQLAIVLPIAGMLALLWHYSAVMARRCVLAGSIVVVLAGSWWFVQRVWFTGGIA